MRLLIATLLAFFTFAASAFGADYGPEVDSFLAQVTSTIRIEMAGIKVQGKGVASDVSFKCWAGGGTPTSVEIEGGGLNADWDKLVKDKLKKAKFPKFSLGEDDQLAINARISYFPDSDKPQPQVIYQNVQREKSGPLWRVGEVLFYGGTYICAVVCIVMQALIVLIGGLDIVRRMIHARASTPAQTE